MKAGWLNLMAPIVNGSAARDRLLNSVIRPRPAKVHTPAHRKAEISQFRSEVGACIERARCLSGLTLEQFASEIQRDPSQVGKWIRNTEPPQLDAILMSSQRGVMLQALAERTPGCEVESVITMRRRA
jgi:hypothetical protein